MIKNDISLLWIIAVIAMGFLISHIAGHFSPEARRAKRRRKNHNPITSKVKRPMVRFSVRTR
jgi:hypothetical protein